MFVLVSRKVTTFDLNLLMKYAILILLVPYMDISKPMGSGVLMKCLDDCLEGIKLLRNSKLR